MRYSRGFTIMEMVIAAGIFALVAVGFYQVYSTIFTTTNILRLKNMGLFVANSQIELIRNATYDDVGISGGLPSGIFDQYTTVTMSGIDFQVERIIRNIDNPFDGTFLGTPQDLSPADNKLVQIKVSCSSCNNFSPLSLVTRVAPRHLETASSNGALRINVFDSAGFSVQGARVQIDNDNEDPPLSFVDTTDTNGQLLIVDAPPGVESYQISISKPGYSTERTYAPGEDGVLNPVQLNLTVATGTVADGSYAIDVLSDLAITSVNPACVSVGDLGFVLRGSKLLSADPDLIKYDERHVTNGAGILTINDLEWDTYSITASDTAYAIIGINPINPFSVDPGQNEEVLIVAEPVDPYMLTVTVLDDNNGLTIADADVQVTRGLFDETLTTGLGTVQQTSWSGGGGQDDYSDPLRFFEQTNIEHAGAPGQLELATTGSEYVSSGSLISSTFDMGENGIVRGLTWAPLSQTTGENSVQFQIASNNDNATWNFLGPDGTSSSYYTATNRTLYAGHEGDRYLRYKLYLSTSDTNQSPIISDVYLTYTSDCVAPGQVTFMGMPSIGDYTVTASASGYITTTSTVSITNDWQAVTVRLPTP